MRREEKIGREKVVIFGSYTRSSLAPRYCLYRIAEDERIVKMEVISVQRDTVTVGLAGFGLVHSGRTSTRTVPKSKIFGGFPCTTFVPSMPIRLLKKIIAGKDQGDLGLWPEKVSPGKISFELNGRVIQDEEVGIGTLSRWGARGKLEVRVGRERVPFVFE